MRERHVDRVEGLGGGLSVAITQPEAFSFRLILSEVRGYSRSVGEIDLRTIIEAPTRCCTYIQWRARERLMLAGDGRGQVSETDHSSTV